MLAANAAFAETEQPYCKEGEQLENYTKYRLKAAQELEQILSGKDNLFVIACNKCFKEFETDNEPDCQEFVAIAEGLGKTITGTPAVAEAFAVIRNDGNRLNAAYSYGGAKLLMETIEKNLGIEVNRYALVNFEAFANLVDAVGGVEMLGTALEEKKPE